VGDRHDPNVVGPPPIQQGEWEMFQPQLLHPGKVCRRRESCRAGQDGFKRGPYVLLKSLGEAVATAFAIKSD
jgi:hypothetical protein